MPCQLKKPQIEFETREFLGGTKDQYTLIYEGSLICPPGESMIFYNKQKENKIELVTRPGGDSPFLSKQGVVCHA